MKNKTNSGNKLKLNKIAVSSLSKLSMHEVKGGGETAKTTKGTSGDMCTTYTMTSFVDNGEIKDQIDLNNQFGY